MLRGLNKYRSGTAVLLGMTVDEVIEEEKELGELVVYENGTPDGRGGLFPATREAVRPIRDVQRDYARHAWDLFDGNYAATARALGVKPNTLRYSYLAQKEGDSDD